MLAQSAAWGACDSFLHAGACSSGPHSILERLVKRSTWQCGTYSFQRITVLHFAILLFIANHDGLHCGELSTLMAKLMATKPMEATKRPMAAAEDAPAGRKRRKQAKARAAADGAWERCMFRIVRKDRFCNIQRCVRLAFLWQRVV